ncbi:TRAP transporter large permease subunit [Methylonatrum kenyense]|uniref:TRAP transporter large permease n=1 Tax=Methylonatrum kenyense TaxID=455253 RepID=UPI0020BE9602|nr:TRAP transporter large permease subunit [Methylonatrum kenyense]MCK8515592.1 TRAP transporter large permease subunit [Methylonatrum kenyense]
MTLWPVAMLPVLLLLMLSGYPAAFALGATAVLFTLLASDLLPGIGLGLPWQPVFHAAEMHAVPQRLYGSIMENYTLVAVPFFVFMGVMLERSGLAEALLRTMGRLFGRLRGGLAISVVLVGVLLGASTGVVGASVVTMAVLALPVMLRQGYDPRLAGGTIAASGTMGQLIPPSLVLIILGDQMGVNVGQLFVGAIVPGLLLAALYACWIALLAWRRPALAPATDHAEGSPSGGSFYLALVVSLAPPLLLMILVLGSILAGIASPTEAGALGAIGATLLALANGRLTLETLRQVGASTVRLSSIVFMVLIGATAFAAVFGALDGQALVTESLSGLPGGQWTFILLVTLIVFLLGFFLDFIEISFIVVPLIVPAALALGVDPLWLGILIALNLQASFLTPPLGFSLFYLRGAAGDLLTTLDIYRGVMPFIGLQLLLIVLVMVFPGLVLWLPERV